MKKVITKIAIVATFTFGIGYTANAAFPTANNATANTVVVENTNSVKESTNIAEATSTTESKAITNITAKSAYGKSMIVAALLAFFLGTLGIHSFYMGQSMKGFLQLGGTLLGLGLYIAGIVAFVSTAATAASTGVFALPILALVGVAIMMGVSIWAFIDFIRILAGSLEPEEGFDS